MSRRKIPKIFIWSHDINIRTSLHVKVEHSLPYLTTMNLKYTALLASGLLVGSVVAYSASSVDRRSFVSNSITGAISSIPFIASKSTMAVTDDAEGTYDGFITTESGLRYKVITVGTGAIPSPGQTVKAHYTGTSIVSYNNNERMFATSPLW
jgi:hypothetical protein